MCYSQNRNTIGALQLLATRWIPKPLQSLCLPLQPQAQRLSVEAPSSSHTGVVSALDSTKAPSQARTFPTLCRLVGVSSQSLHTHTSLGVRAHTSSGWRCSRPGLTVTSSPELASLSHCYSCHAYPNEYVCVCGVIISY